MAKMIAKGEKKGIPYYFEGGSTQRGDKHLYQSYVMFLMNDEETGKKGDWRDGLRSRLSAGSFLPRNIGF